MENMTFRTDLSELKAHSHQYVKGMVKVACYLVFEEQMISGLIST